MKNQVVRYIVTLALAVLPLLSSAQTEEQQETVISTTEVQARMNRFMQELNELALAGASQVELADGTSLSPVLIQSYSERVAALERTLHSIVSRWDTYFVAQQYEIAASDTLMQLVAELDLMKQAVADTIERRKLACQALTDFCDSQNFLLSQDSTYKTLYKEASGLTMTAKTAPLLEKVKAREAVLFAEVQSRYDKARSAVELVPSLADLMPVLDDAYVNLKAVSGKIQTMAYKPFIARIKDYLLGFAAVAVLLLFFNMVVMRLKALQKARASMKQYRDVLKSNQANDYPTI